MTKAVIVSAARTPVGSFMGSFANTPAHDLGAAVLAEVVARENVDVIIYDEEFTATVDRALEGRTDPAAEIASLFRRAGVPHRVEGGRVILT